MWASVEQYLPVARRFLSHRFGGGKVELMKLSTKEVTDFVSQDTASRGRRSAQLMTTVLRSFLGFLLQEGRIATNLAAAVPTVAGWRLSECGGYRLERRAVVHPGKRRSCGSIAPASRCGSSHRRLFAKVPASLFIQTRFHPEQGAVCRLCQSAQCDLQNRSKCFGACRT